MRVHEGWTKMQLPTSPLGKIFLITRAFSGFLNKVT